MPYRSEAQRRYFHAALARGEIPMKTVKDFDTASKVLNLPAHLSKGGEVEEDEHERFMQHALDCEHCRKMFAGGMVDK